MVVIFVITNTKWTVQAKGGYMDIIDKINKYINEEKARKVFSMFGPEIEGVEYYIARAWNVLNTMEDNDVEKFFKDLEYRFSEDIATAFDNKYSSDQIHYYQGGLTKSVGGVDTYELITDFKKIKSWVDQRLKIKG